MSPLAFNKGHTAGAQADSPGETASGHQVIDGGLAQSGFLHDLADTDQAGIGGSVVFHVFSMFVGAAWLRPTWSIVRL